MNLRFEEEQKKERRIQLAKAGVRFLLEAIFFIFLAWLIVTFSMKKVSMIGSSMETTLYNGEEIIINKSSYVLLSPRRNQIIAFYPETEEGEDSSDMNDTVIQIRRVIGLPGEKIKIQEGKVYIDGKELKEKYNFEMMYSAGRAISEITLAEDEYFVLSDNRNDMDDSRNTSFTKVRKKNIIGKAILRLNPLSLLGGPAEQQEESKDE